MRRRLERNIQSSAFFIVVCFVVASCSSGKKIPYFQNIPDSLNMVTIIKHTEFIEHRIRTNDVLSVTINTIDPQASAIFNNASPQAGTRENGMGGFQVDKEGNIELPLVGKLHVAGKTTIEAKEMIKTAVKKFYVDPSVNVRLVNFTITLLGDISAPGQITVSTEKVSILDALGMAGDLQISGRRENVMLIREEGNGEKKYVRIDLTSTDVTQSPYFYLKSGDVIYVEPNKAKSRTATTDYTKDRYFSYIISSISIIFTIINISRSFR